MFELTLAAITGKDLVMGLGVLALSAFCFLAAHMDMRGIIGRWKAEVILEKHGPGRLRTLNRIGGTIFLLCGLSYLTPNFLGERIKRDREEMAAEKEEVAQDLKAMARQRLTQQMSGLLDVVELGEVYQGDSVPNGELEPRIPRPSAEDQKTIRELVTTVFGAITDNSISSKAPDRFPRGTKFAISLRVQNDPAADGGLLIILPEKRQIVVRTAYISKHPRPEAKIKPEVIIVPKQLGRDFSRLAKIQSVRPQ